MSRSRAYAVSFHLPPGSSEDDWLDLVESAMHPRWPDRVCSGGYYSRAAGDEEATAWVYCNRTKAKRIAADLSRRLKAPATLYLLSVDDDEDDTPIAYFGVA